MPMYRKRVSWLKKITNKIAICPEISLTKIFNVEK